MPGLLSTAQQPAVDLAGAAVEAATIVGQAVGIDTFHSDAKKILSWILPNLQSNPLEQLLSACARIASVLKDEFAPYANDVMSILLQQAQQRTKQLLSEPPPQHVPQKVDQVIRNRFPIRLAATHP